MAISYKYKNIKRGDGIERRLPFIPVNIMSKGSSWIQTMALIDSGADVSVIPKDFAELLGLDLSGKRDIANGLGGEVSVVNSSMKEDKLDTVSLLSHSMISLILNMEKEDGKPGFYMAHAIKELNEMYVNPEIDI